MPKPSRIRNVIASLIGQPNVLTIPRLLLKVCGGDHKAALLLSQLCYWSDRATLPGGWVWKTDEEMRDELALSPAEVRRARAVISAYIEHDVRKVGATPRSHYRVKWAPLIAALEAAAITEGETAADDPPDPPPAVPAKPPPAAAPDLSQSHKSPDLSQSHKSDLSLSDKSSYTETTRIDHQQPPLFGAPPAPPRGRGRGKRKEVSAEEQAIRDGVKVMLAAYAEWIGGDLTAPGMNGSAARAMVKKGIALTDVRGCYNYLMTDPFWQDKPITLALIRQRIGKWQQIGRPVSKAPPPSAGRRGSPARSGNGEQYRHWQAQMLARGIAYYLAARLGKQGATEAECREIGEANGIPAPEFRAVWSLAINRRFIESSDGITYQVGKRMEVAHDG